MIEKIMEQYAFGYDFTVSTIYIIYIR